MTQFESIKALPRQFQTIGMIRSVEVKNRLAELIMTIQSLMSDAKGYEPDATTHEVVGRYYGYLLDSCRDRGRESFEIINQRALWMLHYGEVVQHYLLLDKDKRTVRNIILSEDEGDSHLVDKIITMTEAIRDYRIKVRSSPRYDDDILDLLREMLQIGRMIHPDLSSNPYIEITQGIDHLTHLCQYLRECVLDGDGSHEFTIIRQLIELNYKLQNYSLQVGFRRG